MDTTKKDKGLYIVIIALLVVNIATLGFLWYSSLRPGRGPGKEPMQNRPRPEALFQEELKFSPEQMKKIEAMREENFKATDKIHEELKGLQKSMMEVVRTGNDEEAKRIAGLTGEKMKELEMLRYGHFKQIRDMCDETQKQKLDEMTKKIPGPENGPPPDMNRPPELNRRPDMSYPPDTSRK